MKKLLLLIIAVLLLGGGIAFAETGEWRCANYIEVNKATPCGGAAGVDNSSNCPTIKPECNSPDALICCKAGSVSTAPPTTAKTSIACDTYKYPWCEAAGQGLGGSEGLVNTFYKIALALVGVAAFGAIVYGGILYTISAGNSSKQQDAIEWITSAVWGVVLLFGAYFLLNTINPELVELKEPKIEPLSTKIQAPGGAGNCENVPITDCESNPACEIKEGGGVTYAGDLYDICVWKAPDGNLSYDSGIESQKTDASSALSTFLTCMANNLPSGVGRVSSISDSAGVSTCSTNYSKPPCAHTNYSCHYGGKSTACKGKSYAVDFGDEQYAFKITEVAKKCNSNVVVFNEGDHLHASLGNANNCGCN